MEALWKQHPLPKAEQWLNKASNNVQRMNGENVVSFI